MTSDSTQSVSFYDSFPVCNPPSQVYVGGWVRTPSGTGSGTLSVISPTSLLSAAGDAIPFTQISWTSTANGNATADIPAGTFNGGTLALRTIAANTWVENCFTFSYANTAVVAAAPTRARSPTRWCCRESSAGVHRFACVVRLQRLCPPRNRARRHLYRRRHQHDSVRDQRQYTLARRRRPAAVR